MYLNQIIIYILIIELHILIFCLNSSIKKWKKNIFVKITYTYFNTNKINREKK